VHLWDCVTVEMKNITVRVPEQVYRAARIRAAEQGRSVSALVSEFLGSLSGVDGEFDRLAARQREIRERLGRFSAVDRLSRDEIHDRAIR
jgi:plasmid stability protein